MATGKFVKALEAEGLTAEKIRTLAATFHFLSEAVAVEKAHSISAANFGVLKNTSGKSFKPVAAKLNETKPTEAEQNETKSPETQSTETKSPETAREENENDA